MKRSGDRGQLSKEEYNAQEDDEEEAGVYKKASAEQMASRKIVKRGSKFGSFGSQNSAPSNNNNFAKPSSAFSSMTAKSMHEAPKAGNIFGSINLATKTSAPEPPKANGVFGSISLTAGSNSVPIGIKKTPAPAVTAANGSSSSSSITTPSSVPQSNMQRLNKSFLSWMDKQMINHSVSNWSAGLQDYIKHADKIAQTTPEEKEETKEVAKASKFGSFQTSTATNGAVIAPKVPVAAPVSSKFGSSQSNTSTAPTATSTGFSGFSSTSSSSVSASSVSASKTPAFGGFSATTAASATTAVTSKPAAFSGFGGSMKTTAPAVPAVSGFTAGGSTTSSFAVSSAGAPAATTEEYEGEPILEPEKIYKNENDTDMILYETDCKAFRYDTAEKEWKESGKGSLRMTQEPGIEKKKVLVRNTMGKITINAYIFKGMNFKQAGKSGLQFMAVVDASGVPQSFLVKVRASDIQTVLQTFTAAEKDAK